MEILIAIGVFGLVAGLLFAILAPKAQVQDDMIQRRLEAIGTKPATVAPTKIRILTTGEETFWERIANFFLGPKELPEKYTKIRRLLHQAGYAGDRVVRVFWGSRIFFTLAFLGGALVIGSLRGLSVSNLLLAAGVSGSVGYLLPFLYVRRLAKLRVREIQETLPDTLDLLVIAVEAGLGIDAALVRVAREQAEQGLAIGDEFQLMTQEMQAGVMRREALNRMADRVGVDDLRGLVVFVIQTEEVGGSIARSLRVYASTMRQKRSQRAEEAARKAVIKLIFPLVFFILPAMFLVILGPAALNLFKLFEPIK